MGKIFMGGVRWAIARVAPTALLFFIPFFQVHADAPSAVDYLNSQEQDAWSTQALVVSGVSNPPTDHLTSVSGELATDYAKAILALAAAGENPATFGSTDYVTQLKSFYMDNQIGALTLLNDDMWGILALASVGEVSSAESLGAKDFLIVNQNEDGGWGYNVGGTSDSNDTAVAIMALLEAGVSSSDPKITNAFDYLRTTQNDDGGFTYDPTSPWGTASDSGSDAWIVSAIYKAGGDPTAWAKEENTPISHLESLQDDDGGFWWVTEGTSEWNNKAMTAYAVIALSGKSYPVGYWNPPSSSQRKRVIYVPPTIVTGSLPVGMVGKNYSEILSVADGNGSYIWSIFSGVLPMGLNLDKSGVITGNPTNYGTFNFAISVDDGTSTVTKYLSMIVDPVVSVTNNTSILELPVASSSEQEETEDASDNNPAPEIISGGEVLGVQTYTEDSLLRGPDKKIYEIYRGYLKHIMTLDELHANYYGRPIINVSSEIIDSFNIWQNYAVGTLLRGSDYRIYVLLAGDKKKYIPNLLTLSRLYFGREIHDVDQVVIDQYN